MRLQQLGAEHLAAVLEFETVNRAYFAATIADRGDEFFADYPARHDALLRMQAAGTDRFHVLVSAQGEVAGRVNLTDIRDDEAELGYRIGPDFAGRGLATRYVGEVCELAAGRYGLSRLRAETALTNHASRKVLLRNGFGLVAATGTSLLFRLELRRRDRP